MIFGSGIGTLIWINFDSTSYQPRDWLIFGAAFPLIFKKAVAASSKTSMGRKSGKIELKEKDVDKGSFSVKDFINYW